MRTNISGKDAELFLGVYLTVPIDEQVVVDCQLRFRDSPLIEPAHLDGDCVTAGDIARRSA